MPKHWTEKLSCHACGKVHGNMNDEARHRHNFPALCKRGKRFTAFMKENGSG